MELGLREKIIRARAKVGLKEASALGAIALVAGAAPELTQDLQAEPANAQPIAERTADYLHSDPSSLNSLTYSEAGFAPADNVDPPEFTPTPTETPIPTVAPVPTETATPVLTLTPEPTPTVVTSVLSARDLDKKCAKEATNRRPTEFVVRLNKARTAITRFEVTIAGVSAECVNNGTTDVSVELLAQGLGKSTYSTDQLGHKTPIFSSKFLPLAKPKVFNDVPNTLESQTLRLTKPIKLTPSTKRLNFATIKGHGKNKNKNILMGKPGRAVRATKGMATEIYQTEDGLMGDTRILAYHRDLAGLPEHGRGSSY
jgi:hypothetical protein